MFDTLGVLCFVELIPIVQLLWLSLQHLSFISSYLKTMAAASRSKLTTQHSMYWLLIGVGGLTDNCLCWSLGKYQ